MISNGRHRSIAACAVVWSTVTIASACTGGSVDDSSSGSTPAETSEVTSDEAGSGAESGGESNDESTTSIPVAADGGDSIAFCSLAADATRAETRDDFVAIIDDMLAVAPTGVFSDTALIGEAWSNDDFAGADELVDAAVERFVAYQLDECGIVAPTSPPP